MRRNKQIFIYFIYIYIATEMAAKYLHNKKLFLITLTNIAHYYYNGFEEKIYIYIYIYINLAKVRVLNI